MSNYVLTLPQKRLWVAFYKNKNDKRRLYVGEKYMHQKDICEFNDKQKGKTFYQNQSKTLYYMQANKLPWNVAQRKIKP